MKRTVSSKTKWTFSFHSWRQMNDLEIVSFSLLWVKITIDPTLERGCYYVFNSNSRFIFWCSRFSCLIKHYGMTFSVLSFLHSKAVRTKWNEVRVSGVFDGKRRVSNWDFWFRRVSCLKWATLSIYIEVPAVLVMSECWLKNCA